MSTALAVTALFVTDPGPRPSVSAPQPGELNPRVVLLTLDGVRPEDLRAALAPGENQLMPTLGSLLASSAAFGIDPKSSRVTTPTMVPLSLPGYSTIMAGRLTGCLDNRCARIDQPTLPEYIARSHRLPPEKVAVFASWSRTALAATHEDGKVWVDAPRDGARTAQRPWPNARYDKLTFGKAIAHLKKHEPRFLWISLLDTDEWAHQGQRRRYLQALRRSDQRIGELLQVLREVRGSRRPMTTVVISTDHGRGPGPKWTDHGARDGSENVFLIFLGPSAQPTISSKLGALTLADIRPTVERLLGLCPAACDGEGCGRVIPEALGEAAKSDPCTAKR